jgi:hypothetical protein
MTAYFGSTPHIRDKSNSRKIVLARSILCTRCNKHADSLRKKLCRWESMSRSFYNYSHFLRRIPNANGKQPRDLFGHGLHFNYVVIIKADNDHRTVRKFYTRQRNSL